MSEEKREAVTEMVRRQLDREQPPGRAALYGRAQEIDAAIGELTPAQFWGRYVLPVYRERASGSSEATNGSAVREEVKRRLLVFGKRVAAAESTAALIDVLAQVDAVVDDLVELARPG